MDPRIEAHRQITRRQLFGNAAMGVGAAALASLIGRDLTAATEGNLPVGLPQFAGKAKRVIYLMQSGAPSHVDLFDYKPQLEKYREKELPDSVRGGQRLTTMTANQKQFLVLPGITKWKQHGQCGRWISDFLPHTGTIADDICLIKSIHSEAINHAPAMTFFLTGDQRPGRPSIGAWLSYGLGSLNDNLPTFVVMTSRDKELSCGQLFFDYYWGSGFLPTKYQGVELRSTGDPVLYLSNPQGLSREVRRTQLDAIDQLNAMNLQSAGDPEISTRISQYEMAYRMQMSVPEIADLSTEPKEILDMYGPDVLRPGSYAGNCLRARRLAERGVRYIQLLHSGWDQHNNLPTQLKIQCDDTDQPSAALVKDLKQRGMLDDTLVIWGGEFGRTVFGQGDIHAVRYGRDHHPRCFSLWMAGGGVKPGATYGETDDFCYNVAQDAVPVHDLQATILHLLGIEHTRLTYKFQGRRFRLTDVEGNVVKGVLA